MELSPGSFAAKDGWDDLPGCFTRFKEPGFLFLTPARPDFILNGNGEDMRFDLVLGGSRSGKSDFAERLAGRAGEKVTYIATAPALDEEMAERVRRHREIRPLAWSTVEEPLRVAGLIRAAAPGRVFLLDCVGAWVTNMLLDENFPAPSGPDGRKEEAILAEVRRLLAALEESGCRLIAVTNEVGWGLVPEYPLGRAFRDVAGRVNQLLASAAGNVYLCVAGLTIELKALACHQTGGIIS